MDLLVAWLTGLAAVILAAVGVALAVRRARSMERHAAAMELAEVTGWWSECQEDVLRLTAYTHRLRLTLAENGLTSDPPPGRRSPP